MPKNAQISESDLSKPQNIGVLCLTLAALNFQELFVNMFNASQAKLKYEIFFFSAEIITENIRGAFLPPSPV